MDRRARSSYTVMTTRPKTEGADVTTGNTDMSARVIDRRTRPRQRTYWKPSRNDVLIVAVLAAVLLLAGLVALGGKAYADTVTFTADELLGKPTNNSITINVVPASTMQYRYKYGTTSGNLTQQTSPVDATGGQPSEVTITGLTADTKYYYQMIYDGDGSVTDGDFETKTEHSFHTARAAGDSFAFSVTTDGHAGNTSATYTNILNELPDFNIDMGDTFMTDGVSSQTSANSKYLAQRTSSTMGKAGVSVPLFSLPGNHEQEEGWHFSDGQALASIQARKLFFPTPVPGGSFYSANTDTLSSISAATYGDQYREDYYAWTWGDALFVVIDPFQYTPLNSYGNVAGDGTSQQTTDQWTWTLGKQQYDWLTSTLEGSTAKYKFVFSHNMVGGMTHSEPGTPAGYVRGGAEPASYYEWGGYNGSGVYDFNNQRPGWGVDTEHPNGTTIEQLFEENHVSAYFHGHDHQFVYETRNGIVYQECPSAGSMGAFSGIYSVGTHTSPAGNFETISIIAGGQSHLKVSVTSTKATVDLINSGGSVAYTYDILPATTGPTHDLTMAVSPGGSGTTTPAVGTHSYSEGANVGITATPAVGYVFSNWSGGATGSANPTTVTMNTDKTVTANFTAQNYNLTMAVSPSGGGTTTPAVGTASYGANSVVNITATPAAGYAFSSWTGSVADPNSASTTVTMTAAKTVTANFTVVPPGTVTLDGAASTGTGAANAGSVSFSHTTGTGSSRLLVVGVSWNNGSDVRTISSVTFTPGGGGAAQPLALAVHHTHSTQNRDSSIYYLVNPPSGNTGTVAITFSSTVASGIVAGAANFAGVDQTTPIGVTNFADSGSAQNTTPSVTVSGLAGNELVIDNVFQGASSSSQTLTAGSGQTQRWNDFAGSTRAAASTEQAGGSSVTMSWTAASNAYWDIVAAAIRPAASDTFNLTLEAGWNLVAATPGATFPSQLFAWNGSSYQSATSATAWQGYWCKVGSQQSVTVSGVAGPHTVNLTTGWNLIGNSMNGTATLTLPGGVSAFVYDAASGYSSALSLLPGQGAWVKGTSGQSVVLTPAS
jgi:Divergent InlB B-repeat domain